MDRNKFLTNGKLFDDGKCSICLSAPQIKKACPPCGHVFCCQCLTRWNKCRATCPICKTEFSKIAHISGKDQITSVQNAQIEQHIRRPPSPFESGLLYNIVIILFMGIICLGMRISLYELEKLFAGNVFISRIFKALFIVLQAYTFRDVYKYGLYLREYMFFGGVLFITFWA